MSGPGYAPPPQWAPHFQVPGPAGHPSVPPALPHQPLDRLAGLPQRPAVITLACTLAVLASLQWICGLTLLWVTATVGTGAFAEVNDNGAVFHLLNRFDDRMLDGLAVPLYLFPLASLVTGFLILSRRPWTRLVHTALGVVALAWSAWWLRENPLWWFSAAWYVAVACLVLWTPAATAWYRWRADDRDGHPLR